MDLDDDPLPDPPEAPVPEGEPSLNPRVIKDEDRLLLIFAYLGPFCLVPLWGARDPFVRWHARQGSGLTLLLAAGLVIAAPFDYLFGPIPVLGRLFRALQFFGGLAYLAVVALAIERAVAGSRYRIPWLSDLADQE